MVQRLKTAKEGWFVIFKGLYLLAFPFLLVFAILFLIAALGSTGQEAKGFSVFAALFAIPVLVSIAFFIKGVLSRRRLLKQVTTAIKAPQFFSPDPSNEIYHEGDGKYLGIDTKNGTILYVHRIRKGQVDVVALTMADWTNREVEGKGIFRLYTKLPELPRIEIGTPWAQRWYDTLGAMEYRQYSTPKSFNQYVQDRLDELERDLNVQIPRLA